MFAAAEKPLHEVQHVMWKSRHDKSCGHEQQPEQAHTYGRIGECYDAGDDRSRSEHDSDLERRGSKFEIMIHVELKIASPFHLLRAARQLDRALALAAAGFGLGAIARG